MTDILDEILAFTEGYKRDAAAEEEEQFRCATSNPTTISVPPAAIVGSALSSQHYFPPQFAPSPRGVQDDFSAFGLIHRGTHPYSSKNELVVTYNPNEQDQSSQQDREQLHEHDDDDDDAAAAVAAAISTCMSRPASASMQTARPPPVSASVAARPHPEHGPAQRSITGASSTTARRAPPPGRRPNLSITPTPPSSQGLSYAGHGPSDGMDGSGYTVVQSPWSTGTKRGYGAMEGEGRLSRPRSEPPQQAQPPEKKLKNEMSVVMPPSAKSILERRERAIREGRRKDAKLTDAERRILRRLRNRESAERCRLRRVQQASQLEKKIESMQVENKRLVAMAEQYEKTIKRLERVIADFSAQQNGHKHL